MIFVLKNHKKQLNVKHFVIFAKEFLPLFLL